MSQIQLWWSTIVTFFNNMLGYIGAHKFFWYGTIFFYYSSPPLKIHTLYMCNLFMCEGDTYCLFGALGQCEDLWWLTEHKKNMSTNTANL